MTVKPIIVSAVFLQADGFLAKAMSIEASWRDIRPYIKARIRRNEGLIKLARNKLSVWTRLEIIMFLKSHLLSESKVLKKS